MLPFFFTTCGVHDCSERCGNSRDELHVAAILAQLDQSVDNGDSRSKFERPLHGSTWCFPNCVPS
jgi:hypothetical protein